MNVIEVLNQDLEKILEVKGERIYIKIIKGIQCICKDISDAYFDGEIIIYTIPRNFFIIQKEEK